MSMIYTKSEKARINKFLSDMLTHTGFINIGSLYVKDNIMVRLYSEERCIEVFSKETYERCEGQLWRYMHLQVKDRPYMTFVFNGKKDIKLFAYMMKKSSNYERFKFYCEQEKLKNILKKLSNGKLKAIS